jgi:hypothetical protein
MVEIFPSNIRLPVTASKYMATVAAKDLTHVIVHPAPASHFSTIGDSQLQEVHQLSEMFPHELQSRHNCPKHETPDIGMTPRAPARVIQ